MTKAGRHAVALALVLGCIGCAAAPALAQGRGSRDPGSDLPPPRRSFGNELPPGGAGTINPTGPSIMNPPGSIAPMPPGGRGSINPTGPLIGAPSGFVQPMPPGGPGSINPTGPPLGTVTVQGVPVQGVLPDRPSPRTTSSGKAPVPPGLEPCLESWTASRGLSEAEHRELCEKIWKRPDLPR